MVLGMAFLTLDAVMSGGADEARSDAVAEGVLLSLVDLFLVFSIEPNSQNCGLGVVI